MVELLKKIDLGARSLFSGALTLDLFPNVRLKPYPPTGVEGLKADAEQIRRYWQEVGMDISGAIKDYGRKKE